MSGVLKWVESKVEHFEGIANESLVENATTDKDKTISKLKHDIATLRTMFREKAYEIQDKYEAKVTQLVDTNAGLEASLKQVNDESAFVKDNIRTLQYQVATLENLNKQLVSTVENAGEVSESPDNKTIEQLVYENSLIAQQTNMYKELLNAEKLKTEDAIREKRQFEELLESNKDAYREQNEELKRQLEKAQAKERQLEKTVEEMTVAEAHTDEEHNLMALSEHLQTKQRAIESLISEKATLSYLLENEVCCI